MTREKESEKPRNIPGRGAGYRGGGSGEGETVDSGREGEEQA